MKPLFTTVAAVAVMAATPALAQSFDAWDTDGDTVIEREEFQARVNDAGLFDRFDANDDDVLDADEMLTVRYASMDLDADGTLTVDEWDAWIDARLGERAVNLSAAAWDENGDNVISRAEFDEQVVRYDVIRPYAAGVDVAYDEDVFNDWMYEDQDLDNDLALSHDEFLIDNFGI